MFHLQWRLSPESDPLPGTLGPEGPAQTNCIQRIVALSGRFSLAIIMSKYLEDQGGQPLSASHIGLKSRSSFQIFGISHVACVDERILHHGSGSKLAWFISRR